MASARQLRGSCPYCGRDDLALTEEHVIPAVLGGSLTVDVCDSCNDGANRSVDQPIIRLPDVAIRRALYDIRSQRYRAKEPKIQFTGHLAIEGGKTIYRPGAAVDLEQVVPGSPVVRPDGTFTFAVPAADAEAQIDQMLAELRRKHPGKTIELEDEDLRRSELRFEHGYGLVPSVWPRFAAKVALGLLHRTMPVAWHYHRSAQMLRYAFGRGSFHRDLLISESAVTVFPQPLDESDDEFHWLAPWEHLLSVCERPGGVLVHGVLFGELEFGIAIRTDMLPETGSRAWLLDTRDRHPLELPSLALIRWLAVRRHEYGSASRLHLARPRGSFSGSVRQGRVT